MALTFSLLNDSWVMMMEHVLTQRPSAKGVVILFSSSRPDYFQAHSLILDNRHLKKLKSTMEEGNYTSLCFQSNYNLIVSVGS